MLTICSNLLDSTAEQCSFVMRESHPNNDRSNRYLHDRVNIYTGDAEEREMRTGRHTVRDVFCMVCHAVLGWKYVSSISRHKSRL